MFHDEDSEDPTFSETLELDLGEVEPSIAGPKRPQDRIALADAKPAFIESLREFDPDAAEALGNRHDEAIAESFPASDPPAEDHDGDAGARGRSSPAAEGDEPGGDRRAPGGRRSWSRSRTATEVELDHGRVVIAAITSCTNTSNPSVMIGAGLLARKAVERGPASEAVGEDLAGAGLDRGHRLPRAGRPRPSTSTGSASTSSATAARPASATPARCRRRSRRRSNENDLVVCAVLSGNRNFEGRINQDVRNNYLASPPLCVAYALAGRMDIDLLDEPLGEDADGEPVYLADIWPSSEEIKRDDRRRGPPGDVRAQLRRRLHRRRALARARDPGGRPLHVARLDLRPQAARSSRAWTPEPAADRADRRAPGCSRCSATASPPTTSRPPARSRRTARPGEWLIENGVEPRDFNSYGSRRGNHEVMIRGTFANVRLRNQLVEREGGFTRHFPDGEETTIYEAAMDYADEGVPLVVLAGKEYGSGSSRDWAAKGTALLGVRAVIAESFERIHRSNLIGMGVLPLQFPEGETRRSRSASTGEETIDDRRPRRRRGEDGRR